jgi:hypothetical protein
VRAHATAESAAADEGRGCANGFVRPHHEAATCAAARERSSVAWQRGCANLPHSGAPDADAYAAASSAAAAAAPAPMTKGEVL